VNVVTVDCAALRQRIVDAKQARNQALTENAEAENAGTPLLHSHADIGSLRLAVDVAALEAKDAGCDVDDLVGPNVGAL
jgi:hypothetical protein